MPRAKVGDVLLLGNHHVQVLRVEPNKGTLVLRVDPANLGSEAYWCDHMLDAADSRGWVPSPGSVVRGVPSPFALTDYLYIQKYLRDGRAFGFPVQIWDALQLHREEDNDTTSLVMRVEESGKLGKLSPDTPLRVLRNQLFAITSSPLITYLPFTTRISARAAAIRTLKTRLRRHGTITSILGSLGSGHFESQDTASSKPTIWDNITEDD